MERNVGKKKTQIDELRSFQRFIANHFPFFLNSDWTETRSSPPIAIEKKNEIIDIANNGTHHTNHTLTFNQLFDFRPNPRIAGFFKEASATLFTHAFIHSNVRNSLDTLTAT